MVRGLFFAASTLALTFPTASHAKEPAPVEGGEVIVVTGTPLSVTEKQLKDCLARHCPPNEDIEATLAHADNQFIAGNYKNARITILNSISRNKDQGKSYPVDLYSLYRGGATVDLHLGEREGYQSKTIKSRDALKTGFSEDSAELLIGQLEVGDMRARLGYRDEAFRYYRDVREKADKLGYPNVAARARIRDAWLASQYASPRADNPQQYRKLAREKYNSIVTDYSGKNESVVMFARFGLAKLDRDEGRLDTTDALIVDYAGKMTNLRQRPIMVFEPEIISQDIEIAAMRSAMGGNTLNQLPVSNFVDQWADVGFWVRPDGRVADVEILRKEGESGWLQPVIVSIEGRKYTGTSGGKEDPGYFFVERYSYTSNVLNGATGSRLRNRSPVGQIVKLDLTAEPPKSKPNGD